MRGDRLYRPGGVLGGLSIEEVEFVIANERAEMRWRLRLHSSQPLHHMPPVVIANFVAGVAQFRQGC